MSLRSLGYLLTRRFYPRSRQAEFLPGIVSSVPAAGRPGRSLHSLRDLSSCENAFGPAIATALVGGGLGIWMFLDNNVTDKDTKRDVFMEARFHKWMKRFGRVYPNHEEETRRFEVFEERVKLVDSLNRSSFEYHPNKFADMSNREILAGRRRHKGSSRRDFQEYDEEALLRFSQETMFLVMEETSRAAQKQ